MKMIKECANGIGKPMWARRRAGVFSVTAALAALLLGSAGTPAARAQTAGGANAAKAQQMLEARANMQAKNLGLTPDQTKQLVQVNTAALKQLDALMANPPADRVDAAKALKSIIDSRKAALRKFLSPEQMTKLTETNQRDLASLMTLALDSAMALTPDQMKNIDRANLDYIRKVSSALHAPNKVEAAKVIKMAQKDHDTALEKALTPDQWKQYQAM